MNSFELCLISIVIGLSVTCIYLSEEIKEKEQMVSCPGVVSIW